MDKYIGLDVHLQSCTMVVVGPSGKRLDSQVVETNGRALVEAIKRISGRKHVCLEEGTQSAWLYEVLKPHVEEVVVTVPPKRKGPKDDLRDAMGRAEELRIGALEKVVYKAPRRFTGLRHAVRTYDMMTRDVVRVKNRLRAVYRSRGIATEAGIYGEETRGRWEKKLGVSLRRQAVILGEQLAGLVQLQGEAEAWLRAESKTHEILKKLSTAPGMGVIRTAKVVAIVVTPYRFRTLRQFWSYCGLGIVTRSSADWVNQNGRWIRAQTMQTRGLNRNRQPQLKAVFKGAATTVIRQHAGHPLHQDYERMLESGIKPNLAKLTLARRIAAAVWSMWKHEEVYDPQRPRMNKKA
jgi:transposase